MNIFEEAIMLLKLCPIPESIQQCIFNLLVGYGTNTASAIKTITIPDDIPIRVIVFGSLDRCRHTLYYMERTINHFYDNASHFSKEALFELHNIYLSNKRQTPYIITKTHEITEYLQVIKRKRLIQFITEESRIK